MEISAIVSAATTIGPLIKDLCSSIMNKKDKKTIIELENRLIDKITAYNKALEGEIRKLRLHLGVLYIISLLSLISSIILYYKSR